MDTPAEFRKSALEIPPVLLSGAFGSPHMVANAGDADARQVRRHPPESRETD
jgi:hypothetical protein